jgi:hypothetical protein
VRADGDDRFAQLDVAELTTALATERSSGPVASTRRPADGAINGGNGPLDASFVADAIVSPTALN